MATMNSKTEAVGAVTGDTIEAVRVRSDAGLVATPLGILTLLEAHPKGGEGWTFEWHRIGVKASHPRVASGGAFVIPFGNITSILVK